MTSVLPADLAFGCSEQLPLAYPPSPFTGLYRCSPEDFIVDEVLGFEPEGQGEHLFLQIEKRNKSTAYVAEALAQRASIHPKRVSFSGMKDRHALTQQMYSLHLPGQADPDLPSLEGEGWRIIHAQRHPRKLKRGVHRGNHFQLRLRLEAPHDQAAAWLEERWHTLITTGVPNYFGPQRFGVQGRNLEQAWQWLEGSSHPRRLGRQKRSLWLSSLRSAVFNLWLAQQVSEGRWLKAQPGCCYQLAGGHSLFTAQLDEPLETLQLRLNQGDLHPTGPLVGQGKPPVLAQALVEEEAFAKRWPSLIKHLEDLGLHQERRSLRLMPEEARMQWHAPWLTLSFYLPRGGFATSLVRELVQPQDAQLIDYAKVAQCNP